MGAGVGKREGKLYPETDCFHMATPLFIRSEPIKIQWPGVIVMGTTLVSSIIKLKGLFHGWWELTKVHVCVFVCV